MDKNAKIDKAVELLIERGMLRSHAYLLGHKFLRKIGILLRPPAFSSYGALAFGLGLYFGLTWGTLMYFTVLPTLFTLFVSAPLAGLFFGLIMASSYKQRARKLNLPKWEEIEA